jgi:ribosomal protein S27E
MQLRCTCGTVAQVGFPEGMRGRWLTCTCPGCGCRLGGRAEENPRPVETIPCPDCGREHYSFGSCPTDEPPEQRGYTREDFEDGLRRPLVRIEDP